MPILIREFDGFVTAKYHGYYYVRVFEHNFTTSRCFESQSEALNISVPGKYSILYRLNESKFTSSGGKYHFIIEYPELHVYNSWNQSLNPYYDRDRLKFNTCVDFGPEEINAIYTLDNHSSLQFGGLVYESLEYGLLEGQPGSYDNWWFTIGLTYKHTHYKENGIPANGIVVNRVRLFARVNTFEFSMDSFYHFCICSVNYIKCFPFSNFPMANLYIFIFL